MSLFSITNALQEIYDTIEENGGEITEEIDEALAIHEQDFKKKVDEYISLISNLSADVDQCSLEIKRIQNLKKIKENTIKRLKSVIADALEAFGDRTPKGVAYLDLGTAKVSVRRSHSTEVNTDYIDHIGRDIANYMLGLAENNMLLSSDPNRDREFIDEHKLSDYDLYPTKVKLSFETDACSLIRGVFDDKIKKLFDAEIGDKVRLEVSVDKTEAKKILEQGNPLSVADVVINKSITIR